MKEIPSLICIHTSKIEETLHKIVKFPPYVLELCQRQLQLPPPRHTQLEQSFKIIKENEGKTLSIFRNLIHALFKKSNWK